jgi:hypothetical protein
MKSLQKSHDTGSDTSAETIGSDSGRGGSESDMPHSANIPGNYTFSILNMFLYLEIQGEGLVHIYWYNPATLLCLS